MGRKKKGYSAPAGLVRHPGSANWFIKWRKIYKSTGTPDLDKARLIFIEVQRIVLSEEMKAKEIAGHGMRFSKMIARYLKEITPGKRSARADRTNSKHPLRFFKTVFKDPPIDGITIQHIYKFTDWRSIQARRYGEREDAEPIKVSGSTVNRELSLMSDAFRKAIRWGEIKVNPCVGIERFSEPKRDRYITDEELATIVRIARLKKESEHVADISLTLYYTSHRPGRIFGLRWPQIDFGARSIKNKNMAANKRVPEETWINDPLLEILRRLWNQRNLYKVASLYVFRKINGRPYQSIKVSFGRICKQAGIENIQLRDIRHKALTDMLDDDVPLPKVKTAAGHLQTSTTDRYTHLKVNATRQALDSLARRKI